MISSKPLVTMIVALAALLSAACGPTPKELQLDKDLYVLDGADAEGKIGATVLDADGKPINEGVNVVFFSEDTKIIKLDQDGAMKAVSSGEAEVDVEVVGTELKTVAKVRVKIPGAIEVSHEKLRLWTGQEKMNVCSWINSEKGAYIEGFMPEWSSDDPTVVSVEPIPDPAGDPKRNRSYVKLVGKKSGDTYITTKFRHLSQTIRVRVYDEDEEVSLDGTRKSKKKDGEEEATEEKKEEE